MAVEEVKEAEEPGETEIQANTEAEVESREETSSRERGIIEIIILEKEAGTILEDNLAREEADFS